MLISSTYWTLRQLTAHNLILCNMSVKFNFQIILPHFLSAMKPYIHENWSEDLQDAWITFLTIIFYHMREGMHEELNSQEMQQQKEYMQYSLTVE